MSTRIKWTDRTFSFDFPAGIYPEMIERIRGTPARLEEHFASLPSELLILPLWSGPEAKLAVQPSPETVTASTV